MAYKPYRRRATGKTGTMPLPVERQLAGEPAQPRTLPEADEPAGATGVSRPVAEGEDRLRFEDDPRTSSPGSAPRV